MYKTERERERERERDESKFVSKYILVTFITISEVLIEETKTFLFSVLQIIKTPVHGNMNLKSSYFITTLSEYGDFNFSLLIYQTMQFYLSKNVSVCYVSSVSLNFLFLLDV